MTDFQAQWSDGNRHSRSCGQSNMTPLAAACGCSASAVITVPPGAVLTAAAVGGLVAARLSPPVTVALAATGSLLMVHDWKDRSIWFKRGYGTQP